MSLNKALTGGVYTICGIFMPENIRSHVETLGIIPGARVRVLQSVPSGCIIEVFGSKVALGQGVAKCINVNIMER